MNVLSEGRNVGSANLFSGLDVRETALQAVASTIVLLSGGIDSAVLLRGLLQETAPVPLFVQYGQRAGAREASAARSQCDALGLTLVTLDVTSVGDVFVGASRARPHVPLP